MTFANLLIFAVLGVVGATYVSNVEIFAKCTIGELMKAMSCAQTMNAFRDKKSPSSLINTTELAKFRGSCDELEKCHTRIGHCPPFGTNDTDKAFNTINAYCGVINNVADNLIECVNELEEDEVSNKCFKEWHPFQKAGELKSADKTEACKNIFGKDQCIKTSLIKHCGQDKWEKFRDALIDLNNAVQQCDLSNVV